MDIINRESVAILEKRDDQIISYLWAQLIQ